MFEQPGCRIDGGPLVRLQPLLAPARGICLPRIFDVSTPGLS